MSEAPFIASTRAAYDATATRYAEAVAPQLADMPLERALFAVFANLVRRTGNHTVIDVGCGPGHVTQSLTDLGLDALGIDLSPRMVELARDEYPQARFEVGSMLELKLDDRSVGGALAFYSIIHIPWQLRPLVFGEFARVVVPGGWLLLGFPVGDEQRHRDEAYGSAVDLDSYRQRPEEVAELLRRAGFAVRNTVVTEPDAGQTLTHCLLLARR